MKIPRLLAGIIACLALSNCVAADPPKELPKFGELPLPKVPDAPITIKPDPDRVRDLNGKNFRLFWVEGYTGKIPVRWSVTPIDTGADLRLLPAPKDKMPGFLEGDPEPKEHQIPPTAQNAVTAWGVADGRVLVTADGVVGDAIVTLFKVVVNVKGGQGAQPPPIVVPPTTETGYLMIVRANGPASPEFANLMLDPAWGELRAKGIEVKDKTLESIAGFYTMPPGVTLPVVVSLKLNADRTKSREVVPRQPLPTTSEGIRKLGEALK